MFKQPRMSSNQSHFARVPAAEIPRSVFNRSHAMKTTFDAGYLVPIYVDEVLPGDSFKMRMTSFARLATPVVPVMDNLYADVFFFFVPNRLVWENWERFNGAQDNPTDSTDFLVPTMTAPDGQGGAPTGFEVGSLSDYFGIPTGVPSLTVVSLWHRAYNLIWNEWFRDQNLQNSLPVPRDDGPDTYTDFVLQRRGKRHDYFTSALPWTQKGPSVLLPLGTQAPVYGHAFTSEADDLPPIWRGVDPLTPAVFDSFRLSSASSTGEVIAVPPGADGPYALGLGTKEAYEALDTPNKARPPYADLSEATSATINQLREAFQLQRLLERDARGGTRYVELLKSHFGVVSPDFRLQRPEYLGGGSTMINTAPIAQTSSSDDVTPQGNLAAMGTFSHTGIGFNKSFVEHGLIIGLISVRADLTYQQGLNRMFSRQTRYDFYWPALAHLGEQAVLNKEIYAQGPAGGDEDDDVFGYQERYAEYRYKPSIITGKFRSTFSQSLEVWHLAQEFSDLPVLGETFIQENPPMSRIKALETEPDFLLDVVFDLKSARPMPVYSVPGLIDHF